MFRPYQPKVFLSGHMPDRSGLDSYGRHRFFEMTSSPMIPPNIAPFQSNQTAKHYYNNYVQYNASPSTSDYSSLSGYANLQRQYRFV